MTSNANAFMWVKRYIEAISYKWEPRSAALKKARRVSQLPDKRTKWEYQCNHCNHWFKQKEVQIDHIIPKGRYTKDTFFVWLDRLFCPVTGFQILCRPCHVIKSNTEKANGEYK